MSPKLPLRPSLFVALLWFGSSACVAEDALNPGPSNAAGGAGTSGGGNAGTAAGSGGAGTSGSASGGTSAGTGAASGQGGASGSGGATGGAGAGTGGSGGLAGSGAGADAGGASGGGADSGGTASGGAGAGGDAGGASGGSAGSSAGSAGAFNGTCTESERVTINASGSGPHEVIVETNSDPGIEEGTIFRPADLGGSEKYPIFVWGQGACSRDGLANASAMAEIASHGYFVVADGTPNGTGNRPMDRSMLEAMGAPLVAYIDWALAENDKPCSAYYQSLAPTKIASNGFSCGGLMSQGTVLDPRIVTWGVTSSGMAGAQQDFYDLIHTPVLFVEGGPNEVAYDGALEGYQNIRELDVPVLWFSKDLGHGGDLLQPRGGDFTKINLAWLNWWLKDDETASGKGALVGAGCSYCSDSAWEVMAENVP